MTQPSLHSIHNFYRINDVVATAGQPRPDEFASIRDAGFDVVINLAMPTSSNAIANEDALVAAHGMRYIHIPVVWEHPTARDLDTFFATMDALGDNKVFVHCALNMRVSAFMFLYRVIRQNTPIADARDAVREIWEPNDTWRDFIHAQLRRYGIAQHAF